MLCISSRLSAATESRISERRPSGTRATLSHGPFLRAQARWSVCAPRHSSRPLYYAFSTRPAALLQALGRDIKKFARKLRRSFPIYTVSLEHSYTYGLIGGLLRGKHAALFKNSVFCACEQNVECYIWRDAARDPLARRSYRLLAAREAAKMLRYTRHVYAHLDRAICISSADRDELRALTGCEQIFTGRIVIPEPTERKTQFVRNLQVIFSSTVGYFPNRDGLVWLYREVWPLVRTSTLPRA